MEKYNQVIMDNLDDKIGRIKDELGAGLDARSRTEFDNRPSGFGGMNFGGGPGGFGRF